MYIYVLWLFLVKCISSVFLVYFSLVFVHMPQIVFFLNKHFIFIPSNSSLDTMAAVVPRIIAVMKTHETSLSVQLEALRAILHFVVPGESQNRSYVEAMKHWLSRHSLKNQIVITRGRSFC